jgi:cell division protein FtsB
MKKKCLSSFLIGLILGVGIAISLCQVFFSKADEKALQEKIDSLVQKENVLLDSLTTLSKEMGKERIIVKDSLVKVYIDREIQVNRVKELPLDDAIEYLKNEINQ